MGRIHEQLAAVACMGFTRPAWGRREKVPEPKPFAEVRSAKEVDNFVLGMEQYFRVARIANEANGHCGWVSLVEFESAGRSMRLKGKSSTRDGEESYSSGDEFESKPKDCKPRFSTAENGKSMVTEDRTKERKPLEFFVFAGSYLVRDCPMRAKLAAIALMDESESDNESHKGPRKFGAIKLQERFQREEEPKRLLCLGARRMLRTSDTVYCSSKVTTC